MQPIKHTTCTMTRMWLVLLLLSLCLLETACAAEPDTTYDVVVYGATPGGIAAAVAAEREGQSAVVVEPLKLVGGMLSGGMGFSDSWLMRREALGGLFREFRQRIAADYQRRGVDLPYEVNDVAGAPWTAEPHVAERVFEALLQEAGVKVLLNERLTRVALDEQRITALHTHRGRRLAGKIFIDASYEGDLLAAAKVDYRLGRESRDEFGESLAGVRYPGDKKPVSNVPALDASGAPLPMITGTEAAPPGQGDRKIQVYNFRPCLTDVPENRVPFSRPADYDPSRYELFRQLYQTYPDYGVAQIPAWIGETGGLPFILLRLPGDKFDANDNLYATPATLSLGLLGASWAYPEADPEQRQAIWNDHRSYTEGLFYFLQTDPALPRRIRQRMRTLGYCKDEFVHFEHFPPVLYVREGRRLVGEYVMTQADILEQQEKHDSIGIGSHAIDSHIVQRIATEEGFIDEGEIMIAESEDLLHLASSGTVTYQGQQMPLGMPYQIPYRSILPKREQCENLLVPVALSASHVAFASLRVEPTWMVLGESAGIAAAMAIEERIPVQQVDISALTKRLQAKGQRLELPSR